MSRALLDALTAHDGVKAVLGDPVRIRDGDGDRPAYPFIQMIRQEFRPAGSAGFPASENTLDLAVFSRNDNGMGSREGIDAVLDAIRDSGLEMDGWRTVLIAPVLADVMPSSPGIWRGILRVRIVVEAA